MGSLPVPVPGPGYPITTRDEAPASARERPHPGAQLDLKDGWRYTAFATDTPAGQRAWLDARHRAHARVEDRSGPWE